MFITENDIDIMFSEGRLSELLESDPTFKSYVVDYANSLVETSLIDRYSLPLDPVPDVIIDIALSIAKYKLYERMDAVTEDILNQYKVAVSILDDFTTSKKTIPNLSIANKPSHIYTKNREQVFSDNILSRL